VLDQKPSNPARRAIDAGAGFEVGIDRGRRFVSVVPAVGAALENVRSAALVSVAAGLTSRR
jgi:hypothetical protein